jgi:hypothetical protein
VLPTTYHPAKPPCLPTAQAYAVLLVDTRVGLLGAAYLALLTAVFLLQPSRSAFRLQAQLRTRAAAAQLR